ncbi:MAG: thermonuclease family protein [Bdellovibrionales bacterium]
MRIWRAAGVFVLLLFSCPALADSLVAAKGAASGDEVALEDGRLLRLRNIKAAAPEAKAFLESAVSGRDLILQDETEDRFGRVTASVFVKETRDSVEALLLREGLAFVYPVWDDEPLDDLCEVEREARTEKRGFWSTHEDVPSEQAATLNGKLGFITGSVSKAERIKNKVYLYMGERNPPDLTIVIAARYLRPLKKRGVEPFSLIGKQVRVRGWVTDVGGPTMTVADVHQIELVE